MNAVDDAINPGSHYLKDELYELIATNPIVFEFLQQGSLDGIWYWDIENPTEEWMSQQFWEVFGYDPAQMPHKAEAWQDMINPDDLVVAMENFEKHCADPNHPYDQVVRYTHMDGSTVWIRCRGIAIRDSEGRARRMLGAHTDVTSVKRGEELLKEKNRQLEVANQQLTQFAYAASHDLQSPIRALSGLLTILYEDHYNQIDADGQNVLEMALRSAERVSNLTSEILAFSQSGRSTEPFSRVDVKRLLSEIQIDLRHEIEKHSSRIIVHDMPQIPGQSTQLRRVFLNLISNALKFRDNTKSDPMEIVISAESQEQHIIIKVSDNGIGMDQKQLARIFDPFTQLNAKTVYGGVGLGLSLCSRIINSHDGEIWAESTRGEGSSFFVKLPIDTELLDK